MKEQNVLMAILAYIGPLVIISYIFAKDDPFVKFHIKQGLVLFSAEIILWVLMTFFWMIFWHFWFIVQIIHFAIFVLAVLGIINAAQHKEKELPLVGQFASHFKI